MYVSLNCKNYFFLCNIHQISKFLILAYLNNDKLYFISDFYKQ